MSYFSKIYYLTREQAILKKRRHRRFFFEAGDILSLFFRVKYSSFFFNGICISVKKKNSPNFSFLTFNILSRIAVEIALLYYFNRIFQYRLSDFKRKAFYYNRSKLYYLKYIRKFNPV